jgi:hypothetical protein
LQGVSEQDVPVISFLSVTAPTLFAAMLLASTYLDPNPNKISDQSWIGAAHAAFGDKPEPEPEPELDIFNLIRMLPVRG